MAKKCKYCGKLKSLTDSLECKLQKMRLPKNPQDPGKEVLVPVSDSGFMREKKDDKINYDLIPLWFFTRLAKLYTTGAQAKGHRNWEKASTETDLQSFRESAWRHFVQFIDGQTNEDHLCAVIFNLIGMEHVRMKLNSLDNQN